MKLFAQITKVDEAKRTVFGRAVQEVVDHSGEIFDYLSSKPFFEKWSADVAKDSGGKSLGNVRAMHGNTAAGKLTGIEFNDTEKAIDIETKVVDVNEWKKVLEGVYTGFSIGGKYVDGSRKVEKVGGKDVTRYTASPNEISLVDRPCIPTAKFFDVVKTDGTLAKVEFKTPEPEEFTVTGSAEEVKALGKMMNASNLTMGQVVELVTKSLAKSKADGEDTAGGGEGSDTVKGGEGNDTAAAGAGGDNGEGGSKKKDDCDAAEKLLTDALGALSKIDDPAVKQRLEKINAALNSDEDAVKKAALEKAEVERKAELAKMVSDAVAPLQKALDEAHTRIETISKQPARATISLMAVTKGADVVTEDTAAKQAVEKLSAPIKDAAGEEHRAAGSIRAIHAFGGVPLAANPHAPR